MRAFFTWKCGACGQTHSRYLISGTAEEGFMSVTRPPALGEPVYHKVEQVVPGDDFIIAPARPVDLTCDQPDVDLPVDPFAPRRRR